MPIIPSTQQFLDIALPQGVDLSLRVKNAGHGMSPKLMAKRFDPYFIAKYKGHGTLGIFKNHGGAIKVERNEWHGTDFEVCLLLSENAEPSEQKRSRSLPTGLEMVFVTMMNRI